MNQYRRAKGVGGGESGNVVIVWGLTCLAFEVSLLFSIDERVLLLRCRPSPVLVLEMSRGAVQNGLIAR